MSKIRIDRRLSKECECYDKLGNQIHSLALDKIDSCNTFFKYTDSIYTKLRYKILIADYKRKGSEWLKNEYGKNGELLGKLKVMEPFEKWATHTDTFWVENPDPPYDLNSYIVTYYQMFEELSH